MKKSIAIILCVTLLLTALLAGCGSKPLKFGAGVFVSAPTATDAGEKDGAGKYDITVAGITVDEGGKIVACALDTLQVSAGFTTEGKAIAKESFPTKYELGNGYNMVAYGGATKEWFEQADAFEGVVVGKTLAEVKALMVEGNKGNDDVIKAGCTITIEAFVAAIEKAFANVAESKATAKDTLKIGMFTEQSLADATEEKDGSNQVATTIVVTAVGADGKVTAASSDCVQVKFTFNTQGVSTFDTSKSVLTKKEQGMDYGMVAYAGATKEWFEQAAAFDAACIGKTASEIAGLMDAEGTPNADLQAAGCTITVTGFVKAATK